jgi:hypothetical protein
MILLDNRPAAALAQFEATLKKEPGRFRSLYGAAHAANLAGHPDQARTYYLQLQKICEHSDHPARPELREAMESRLAGHE